MWGLLPLSPRLPANPAGLLALSKLEMAQYPVTKSLNLKVHADKGLTVVKATGLTFLSASLGQLLPSGVA